MNEQVTGLIQEYYPYQFEYFENIDWEVLRYVRVLGRRGRGRTGTYNQCYIMADTETSKKPYTTPIYNEGKEIRRTTENHVVAWTVSVRAWGINLLTAWGRRPSDMVETLERIHNTMGGDYTFIFFHNLSYDWQFLRKFMFSAWGIPKAQLNTKSHYPINIEFENHILIRDSLILAQRSLDKWARDMDVPHKKAVGKWDYDKIRNQNEQFTPEELEYIEHDTLAGAECLEATAISLHKDVYTLPYTATGIPREQVQKIGAEHNGKDRFLKIAPDYEVYLLMEFLYHGGYTHANRYAVGFVLDDIKCYDFVSSYPFCMLARKYPIEKFIRVQEDLTLDYIILQSEDYAYILCLKMVQPELKTWLEPMPVLQASKCYHLINPVFDNGRVLCADYAEIWITEQDLYLIMQQYKFTDVRCCMIYTARKDYLPRWFSDYVFACYEDKCKLKNGDPVLYSIAKAKLNSLYGMCVQRAIRDNVVENYETGEYESEEKRTEEEYTRYLNNFKTILPYQWGVWVTAYAERNLFELGKCCKDWIYSDTDSVYGSGWDPEALARYNEKCKQDLLANGYGAVDLDGKQFWLGIAELDKECAEFKVLGAKRYAYRDGSGLHITVAGVPKSGVKCLDDDITNFRTGFVFNGSRTGKLQHSYFYVDEIYTDPDGNETGDSINLEPCDYLLSAVEIDPDYIEEEGAEYFGTEEDRLL